MRRFSTIAVALAFFGAIMSVEAKATVLVQDDFLPGSSSTELIGTTADVGGMWTGSGTPGTLLIKSDGSVTTTSAQSVSAFQAFTLVAGRTYTLSAHVNATGGGSNWLAIGFADGSGRGDIHINAGPGVSQVTPYAWMLLANNGTFFAINGPNASNIAVGPLSRPASSDLKIVLDTTGSYNAKYYVNNVQEGVLAGYALAGPTLSTVFVSAFNDADGVFSNFLLEDNIAATVVPEPSTCALGLIGLAALGLATAARRRGGGRKE